METTSNALLAKQRDLDNASTAHEKLGELYDELKSRLMEQDEVFLLYH